MSSQQTKQNTSKFAAKWLAVIEALDASTFCIQFSLLHNVLSKFVIGLIESVPKFELHQAKSVEYKAIASAIRIDQSLCFEHVGEWHSGFSRLKGRWRTIFNPVCALAVNRLIQRFSAQLVSWNSIVLGSKIAGFLPRGGSGGLESEEKRALQTHWGIPGLQKYFVLSARFV